MTQQDAGVLLLKMSCDWLVLDKADLRGTRVPFAERATSSNFVASQQTCRATSKTSKRQHRRILTIRQPICRIERYQTSATRILYDLRPRLRSRSSSGAGLILRAISRGPTICSSSCRYSDKPNPLAREDSLARLKLLSLLSRHKRATSLARHRAQASRPRR